MTQSDRIRLQKELAEERTLLTSLTIMLQRMSTHAGKAELIRLYNEWIDPVEKWIKCLETELHQEESDGREPGPDNTHPNTLPVYDYSISQAP